MALAIVIGKYVWIDFVFDYKLGMIKKYFENLKSNTTESIIANYCMAYLIYFMIMQIGTKLVMIYIKNL